MTHVTRWLGLVCFVVLTLVGRAAWAGNPAADLKAQADAAMDAHHYDEAIAAYDKAYALSPDPALLYNRGRAHEARSEYPLALDDIEKFAAEAPAALKARVPQLAELLTDLRSRVSTLQLTCSVNGARVLVAGKEIGMTPLAPTRLNAGKATLEIVSPDYGTYKREIDLVRGGTTAIEAVLVAKATQGVLVVRTAPSGASILLDDAPFGTSPTEGTVAAGRHTILARLPGMLDATAQALVEPGQRREIEVPLQAPKRSIFASPVFWTIVGVVVVGAATATIIGAAVTERNPDVGVGFSPPRVSGP